MSRFARRVDANHGVIVGAFRACGCNVLSMAPLGSGAPDLLVEHRATRRLFLVEVKDGSKPPSARELTDDQIKFHAIWNVHIVETIEQAMALVAGAAVPNWMQ
jgi:hypothetical protein